MNRNDAKKRLMFIHREDYNFLAYSLIILLKSLNCVKENKQFRDFRKIAYLIDFINNDGEISNYSESELAIIYSRSQIKKQLLHHLLIILRNKDYIGISRNDTHKSFNLWLKEENLPEGFIDKVYFAHQFDNIQALKKLVRSLITVSMKDLTTTVFKDNNVLTWEI